MTTILPVLTLFIGLKYYELNNKSDPITLTHKMILYGFLFIIAILSNIFTLYVYLNVYLNGSAKVFENIQLWVYTAMCWCLFIVVSIIIDLPETQGMIQPFSNTFGYFYVKRNADVIINNMLSEYETSPDHEIKRILRQINSDNSLLLNSMSLTNIDDIWKQFVGNDINEGNGGDNKTKLIGILRDKMFVGKCVWYIYTGILVYFLLAYYNTKTISTIT
jgi:hypothetical protein